MKRSNKKNIYKKEKEAILYHSIYVRSNTSDQPHNINTRHITGHSQGSSSWQGHRTGTPAWHPGWSGQHGP